MFHKDSYSTYIYGHSINQQDEVTFSLQIREVPSNLKEATTKVLMFQWHGWDSCSTIPATPQEPNVIGEGSDMPPSTHIKSPMICDELWRCQAWVWSTNVAVGAPAAWSMSKFIPAWRPNSEKATNAVPPPHPPLCCQLIVGCAIVLWQYKLRSEYISLVGFLMLSSLNRMGWFINLCGCFLTC